MKHHCGLLSNIIIILLYENSFLSIKIEIKLLLIKIIIKGNYV